MKSPSLLALAFATTLLTGCGDKSESNEKVRGIESYVNSTPISSSEQQAIQQDFNAWLSADVRAKSLYDLMNKDIDSYIERNRIYLEKRGDITETDTKQLSDVYDVAKKSALDFDSYRTLKNKDMTPFAPLTVYGMIRIDELIDKEIDNLWETAKIKRDDKLTAIYNTEDSRIKRGLSLPEFLVRAYNVLEKNVGFVESGLGIVGYSEIHNSFSGSARAYASREILEDEILKPVVSQYNSYSQDDFIFKAQKNLIQERGLMDSKKKFMGETRWQD
ncbi:hypothetical protein EXS72_00655 [Candidatus Pacearchaeota archaeon]|nr:hypothetical protein [Candidatus Pacearchaeota archaeon]